ncbi:MAG: hypothetical protein HY291_12275 [Planctomycetes bacterium]|nr:hypothetical protein [Planctomycetota bacterium]
MPEVRIYSGSAESEKPGLIVQVIGFIPLPIMAKLLYNLMNYGQHVHTAMKEMEIQYNNYSTILFFTLLDFGGPWWGIGLCVMGSIAYWIWGIRTMSRVVWFNTIVIIIYLSLMWFIFDATLNPMFELMGKVNGNNH